MWERFAGGAGSCRGGSLRAAQPSCELLAGGKPEFPEHPPDSSAGPLSRRASQASGVLGSSAAVALLCKEIAHRKPARGWERQGERGRRYPGQVRQRLPLVLQHELCGPESRDHSDVRETFQEYS